MKWLCEQLQHALRFLAFQLALSVDPKHQIVIVYVRFHHLEMDVPHASIVVLPVLAQPIMIVILV